MIYIADTHSLIWFLSEDDQLSLKAREVFEQAEKGNATIVIPTIVLAEMLYICEQKGFEDTFFSLVKKIRNSANYMVYDLTLGIILACQNMKRLKEIHDKIIVATAKTVEGTIITRDHEIEKSGYAKTVW